MHTQGHNHVPVVEDDERKRAGGRERERERNVKSETLLVMQVLFSSSRILQMFFENFLWPKVSAGFDDCCNVSAILLQINCGSTGKFTATAVLFCPVVFVLQPLSRCVFGRKCTFLYLLS